MADHYLLTRFEAAERYCISVRQIDKLIRDPTFPVVRIGRSVRIHRDWADKWFDDTVGYKAMA